MNTVAELFRYLALCRHHTYTLTFVRTNESKTGQWCYKVVVRQKRSDRGGRKIHDITRLMAEAGHLKVNRGSFCPPTGIDNMLKYILDRATGYGEETVSKFKIVRFYNEY